MSDASLLPPPPPSAVDDAAAPGRSRTAIAVLAVAASIAALVFGLLWIGASGSRDDAVDERDLALDERGAAIARGIELNDELETTQDQLTDAEAATEAESAPDASTDMTEIDAPGRGRAIDRRRGTPHRGERGVASGPRRS